MAAAAGYSIRLARPEDVESIPEIELAAAELFRGTPFAEMVLGDASPLDELHHAQREGLLWIAAAPGGEPVGFAFVELVAGAAHLDELDVHPDHARRGLGSELVRAVRAGARARGLPAVTLTTFREIPWNAPFYASLGFVPLTTRELGRELTALVDAEHASGLPKEDRVVMRCDVSRS